MRILLIGNRGMLGSMLQNTLKTNHEVVGWDRDQIDISDERQVNEKIPTVNPDIIINAAAFTAVDDCEIKQDTAMLINGKAVGYIAKTAAQLDIPVIHYSTDYVFKGDKKEGYRENDTPEPISIYGKSKYIGERELLKNQPKSYLLRTSWLYGPNGKNWVETMIQLSKTKPALAIVTDQHGKPSMTKDVAETTKQIIEKNMPFGIYHVINEEETNWYDFGREIFRQMNINIAVKPTTTAEFFKNRPYFAKRPEYSSLINTKLKPLRPWKEALADYLTHIR